MLVHQRHLGALAVDIHTDYTLIRASFPELVCSRSLRLSG
jgi:hypothetical protein